MGFFKNYWKDYIFKLNDGFVMQYQFDKYGYELEYGKQCSVKLVRGQFFKDIKGEIIKEVIEEIMKSVMVIGII